MTTRHQRARRSRRQVAGPGSSSSRERPGARRTPDAAPEPSRNPRSRGSPGISPARLKCEASGHPLHQHYTLGSVPRHAETWTHPESRRFRRVRRFGRDPTWSPPAAWHRRPLRRSGYRRMTSMTSHVSMTLMSRSKRFRLALTGKGEAPCQPPYRLLPGIIWWAQLGLTLRITSRTRSGDVNAMFAIFATSIRCADNRTICARRHVTTDPDDRRTIFNNRLPSSFEISRTYRRSVIHRSQQATTTKWWTGTRPARATARHHGVADVGQSTRAPGRRPSSAGRQRPFDRSALWPRRHPAVSASMSTRSYRSA